MVGANYYFSFNALLLGLCLPLIAVQLFLHVSSTAEVGFFADVIHRDSPESPLLNHSSTPFSRLHAAVHRSASRMNYLHRTHFPDFIAPPPGPLQDGLSTSLTNYDFEFLMTFYLGSKRVKVFAGIDTGSNFIWVLCNPCKKCYKHIPANFHPTSSKSYRQLKCGVHPCTLSPDTSCNGKNKCQYYIEYHDESSVKGILSTDTLGLNFVTDDRIYDVNKVIFGCTHNTKGVFDEGSIGMVGLNRNVLSLMSQLGSSFGKRFSYCLPSKLDHRSRMYFGTAAIVSGPEIKTTPLFHGTIKDSYYLLLETIRVGELEPIIVSSMQDSNEGNIVIDSGAILTYITPIQELLEKVKLLIPLPLKHEDSYDLCFDTSGTTKKIQTPNITFKFAGDVEFVLEGKKTFVKIEDNKMCLLIVSNTRSSGVQIIGNRAQLGYRIGFDIDVGTLAFHKEDC